MRRFQNLSEEQLLELERTWESQEAPAGMLEEEHQNEGMALYQALSKCNPNEERYKLQLVQLLLCEENELKLNDLPVQQDEKKKRYKEAKRIFQQVLKLKPDHPGVCYRLGFLYFYGENWDKAISFWQKALLITSEHHSFHLASDQKIKANAYIAKALHFKSQQSLLEAQKLFNEEKDEAVKGETILMIEELKKQVFPSYQEEEKPFQLIDSNKSKRYITLREYENLAIPEKDTAILNFVHENDVTFYTIYGEVHLNKKYAYLLQFLMISGRFVNVDEIVKRFLFLQNAQDSKALLYQMMRRLRLRLAPAVNRDGEEIIIKTTEGYKWNQEIKYIILKNKDGIDEWIHA
ncbi:tetratricopeptide repeat protein [Bacillus taeanensis]|uniref:Uncharacterized protein n=1 Tax=Bacillus taeanensis TaxID=273032 RepID=A0A366XVK2_9BACI|nr:tetratricopeptide repeat protein [Bacillus taeanensis]RBW69676.1 hypothetical protein DS031_10660 [Bacillus taeanensis]